MPRNYTKNQEREQALEVILDTEGAVFGRGLKHPEPDVTRWRDLSPFTQGFGEAMARALYEMLVEQDWTPERAADAVAFRNWAPETLARIMADCERKAAPLWRFYRDAPAGRQFWENRQAGAYPELPPLTPYRADDGKVYLS